MSLPFDETSSCPECQGDWQLWIALEEIVVVRCLAGHEWKLSRIFEQRRDDEH